MTKEEVLKKYKVKSLEDISDGDILMLALNGSLGDCTRVSATMDWCFETEKDLADNIRKAIDIGKELYVSFEWGEEKTVDKVVIDFK